jgi:hypothetical protein
LFLSKHFGQKNLKNWLPAVWPPQSAYCFMHSIYFPVLYYKWFFGKNCPQLFFHPKWLVCIVLGGFQFHDGPGVFSQNPGSCAFRVSAQPLSYSPSPGSCVLNKNSYLIKCRGHKYLLSLTKQVGQKMSYMFYVKMSDTNLGCSHPWHSLEPIFSQLHIHFTYLFIWCMYKQELPTF